VSRAGSLTSGTEQEESCHLTPRVTGSARGS
jgi:hypothetical protein